MLSILFRWTSLFKALQLSLKRMRSYEFEPKNIDNWLGQMVIMMSAAIWWFWWLPIAIWWMPWFQENQDEISSSRVFGRRTSVNLCSIGQVAQGPPTFDAFNVLSGMYDGRDFFFICRTHHLNTLPLSCAVVKSVLSRVGCVDVHVSCAHIHRQGTAHSTAVGKY